MQECDENGKAKVEYVDGKFDKYTNKNVGCNVGVLRKQKNNEAFLSYCLYVTMRWADNRRSHSHTEKQTYKHTDAQRHTIHTHNASCCASDNFTKSPTNITERRMEIMMTRMQIKLES